MGNVQGDSEKAGRAGPSWELSVCLRIPRVSDSLFPEQLPILAAHPLGTWSNTLTSKPHRPDLDELFAEGSGVGTF